MKTKVLLLLLISTFNSYAQDTVTVREKLICEAFWQIFESDSLNFEFQNIEKESIGFYSIIHYTDTIVNLKACGSDDFDVEPYIILEHHFDCNNISKIIFYNDDKRIEKIGFYIEVYDDSGNYISEALLFWMIYKSK